MVLPHFCLKIERTLGVFVDRFGWPGCPLPLPASQDQENGVCRTVLVGLAALCCCLKRMASSGLLWSAKLSFAVATTPQVFQSFNEAVPSLRDVKYSQFGQARSEADCCLFCLLPLCYRNAIPSFTSCLTQNKLASSFFQYLDTQDLFLLDAFDFCSKPVVIKTLWDFFFSFCSSFSWIEPM